MNRFFLFAINMLIMSTYGLPQEDSSRVEPIAEEATSEEEQPAMVPSPGENFVTGEPRETDEWNTDESALEDYSYDEIANQDGDGSFQERATQLNPGSESWDRPPGSESQYRPPGSESQYRPPLNPGSESWNRPPGSESQYRPPLNPGSESWNRPPGSESQYRPPPRPTLVCTTYTEAGRRQREQAIKVCQSKGLDHVDCVKQFCSAANGPTLNCNSNCTRCPSSQHQDGY